MAGARVLHWNGKDIPEELRELPAGTCGVEAVEQAACGARYHRGERWPPQ